jgi:hypothetical protein
MSDEEVIYRGYRLFVHPFNLGWRTLRPVSHWWGRSRRS